MNDFLQWFYKEENGARYNESRKLFEEIDKLSELNHLFFDTNRPRYGWDRPEWVETWKDIVNCMDLGITDD